MFFFFCQFFPLTIIIIIFSCEIQAMLMTANHGAPELRYEFSWELENFLSLSLDYSPDTRCRFFSFNIVAWF
jgi:hypothetical protein